ncbi:MAG: 4-hydroxy-tetrahydrodipicolinate synthase, partial [Proteobacteria bacterium]|nr:4-hydroxy-tetrahydrodipicolinate synthase [Pseudomonadota bacterium]
ALLERKKLIEIATSCGQKLNKLVIAGCGGNSTASVLQSILEARDSGASAALVVTPYYNKPTQEGLLAHYFFLADHTPIPIVLYNVPSRTGVNLLPDTVAQLWNHPQIIGLKEATGNHSQWLELTSQSFQPNRFLLAGDDDAYATLAALGATGIISATANIAPAVFVKMGQLLECGNFKEAFLLQKRLLPLVRAVFSETNPAPLKYALNRMGRGANCLRLPLVPVRPATQSILDQELKSLEMIT